MREILRSMQLISLTFLGLLQKVLQVDYWPAQKKMQSVQAVVLP
jgi:hypothetical protein